jgi:hypothetical protein
MALRLALSRQLVHAATQLRELAFGNYPGLTYRHSRLSLGESPDPRRAKGDHDHRPALQGRFVATDYTLEACPAVDR